MRRTCGPAQTHNVARGVLLAPAALGRRRLVLWRAIPHVRGGLPRGRILEFLLEPAG